MSRPKAAALDKKEGCLVLVEDDSGNVVWQLLLRNGLRAEEQVGTSRHQRSGKNWKAILVKGNDGSKISASQIQPLLGNVIEEVDPGYFLPPK